MPINLSSLFLLERLSKKHKASLKDRTENVTEDTPVKTRRQRFADYMSPKPTPIPMYSGEKEIFRKGMVLVTDTRLAYIDPFDRMLKTWMFEHMISTHKQFYRTTDLNRRLCKGLIVFSLLVFLVILTIDLLDSNSQNFFLVYIPLVASILIGIKVWNDIKPRYVLHWRMCDLTYGEIVQEPFLRERLLGSTKREDFMNGLANAMNEALSTKSWQPRQQTLDYNLSSNTPNKNTEPEPAKKPTLQLVTESYQ